MKMETLSSVLENGHAYPGSEAYRVDVAEVSAMLALVNGLVLQASFFLHSSSRTGYGPESLSARLNDETVEFISLRCDGKITLMRIDAIAYVRIAGLAPDRNFREGVAAPRRAAEVRLFSGEELAGEFLSMMPPNRSRLSDLLNEPGQRFLLLASGDNSYYINRAAVQQVSPR
jgi:hypothetical protein